VPGWTRRHLIAHVGYNARALSRLVEWGRTGVELPMYASREVRDAEIALGATLPARALRNLVSHAEVHLNVEWRDLDDAGWDVEVQSFDGETIPLRATAWMRAREVWVHAIDLDSGGSFRDFPPDLLDELIADTLRRWTLRGADLDLRLDPSDRAGTVAQGSGDGPTIRGAAADLARWRSGRGAHRLESSTGFLPALPPWF